jgi:plastocyanin
MLGKRGPGDFARNLTLLGVFVLGLIVVIGGIAAAADDARVMIDNFKFAPVPLTVTVGSTVTWLNRDDIPHSIVVPALSVHSHPMDTDESFALRFDKPGTYEYICGLHPFMHGKILVQK